MKTMKKVGIYSGSFNPVHLGHIALVDYLVRQRVVDEVWLIRSPHNPLKAASGLLADHHRSAMLGIAIEGHEGLSISDVEDHLPKPNYTITTLRTLQQQHPNVEFHLIIGADNWLIFEKWRAWDEILRDFHLVVYPRPGCALPVIAPEDYPTVRVVEAPQYDISSTEIRHHLENGISCRGLLDERVEAYIISKNLYKKP